MKKFLLILLAFLLTAAMVCTLAACDDDPAEHTHDYGTLIPETPADCGTNGTKAHYECDGCDKLFVDDNGEKKEVSASELVIPATGQHDYEGQPFVSGGASGHHQLCKVCGTPNADVAHDSFTYTQVSGQRQHTKKCGVCNYEVTENCTVEGNECTLCHADYTPVVGNDETITVHFHPTEWWNAAQLKLYAWYGDGQSTVYPLGAFPGGADFQADTENTGWYTYTFQVPEGHRGTDLYLIVNDKVSTGEDTYDGVQTGNIKVTATELWIAGIVNTEQFYTSPQDATAAEANVPGKDAWIVVGSFTTPGWQNPASTKDNVFVDNKVTVQLAANDEFKVAKNGSWADETTFGYGRYTVSKDAAVSGDISGLLVEGKNADETPNGNIVVKYACTLEITLDTANSEHPLSIVVKEATGLPAEQQQEDITVHFHLTDGWTAAELKLYVWYGADPSTVWPLGAFPGTNVAWQVSEGWYTFTFQVPEGRRGTDLYLIVNDQVSAGVGSYSGNKTGDIEVTATELWIPGIASGDQAYDSKDAALQAEEAVNIVEIDPNDWIIAGTLNGWNETTNNGKYVFKSGTLTISLTQGTEFKLKKNSAGWTAGEIAYSGIGNVTSDTITGVNLKSIFAANGTNIEVLGDCEVQFTINGNKVDIKILSAPNFDFSAPTKYYLLGDKIGWQTQKYLFTDSGNGTYSLTISLESGDSVKISGSDGSWYGMNECQLTGGAASNFTKGNSGNMNVNAACNVVITFNPTAGTITIEFAA